MGHLRTFYVFNQSDVYGSNAEDRTILWQQLCNNIPSPGLPWILMGNFNCCRFQNEKAGGFPFHFSCLGEFNSFIFGNHLSDLYSTSLFYTWFNQQTESPIHLKLDRVLVNETWIAQYPLSHYLVDKPICSDHNPITLKEGSNHLTISRFQFKNFRTSKDDFLNIMLDIFLEPMDKQKSLLTLLDADPTSLPLNSTLKSINGEFADLTSSWTSWMLYNPQDLQIPEISCFPPGRTLPSSMYSTLTDPISYTKIRNVVFSGASSSSPRPHGFNFQFYKSSWHILGPSLCKAVKSFSVKGYLPKGIKSTAIFLIPKTSHVNFVSNFRPISLCNTLNKIISKILATRLKCIMPLIINKARAVFISNRISTDNVILVYEILGFFKKCTKVPYFCAKLDIKKAFDSLSRKFLLLRMAQKGIPLFSSNGLKLVFITCTFLYALMGA
ncbi:hypothetical protein KFK09_026532 [Dendrobium nobile]|uniref:Reverse transcriptase domain-containing protein n=1 Tax=Dendrobium nobile TaxID=94219 RepID=A0A8T3A847_DENNO|nr:hypothetical protein KFK09_026532 [Dendrobium nobile]